MYGLRLRNGEEGTVHCTYPAKFKMGAISSSYASGRMRKRRHMVVCSCLYVCVCVCVCV